MRHQEDVFVITSRSSFGLSGELTGMIITVTGGVSCISDVFPLIFTVTMPVIGCQETTVDLIVPAGSLEDDDRLAERYHTKAMTNAIYTKSSMIIHQ